MTIAAGSLLSDRYHLDRALGEGSFAQVYLATDRRLNRQVAVKVLKPELAAQRDFLRRFTLEAQRVAELDHPNILSIFDYGEAEGTVFLVMPYSDGGTLADRLQRGIPGGGSGIPSLEETGRYLGHAAAALDFAHARGIVHGDVKPQNMLLRDDGKWLLLTDFGLAKLLNVASGSQITPSVVGSSAYMAPEQFQGGGDQAADIYALGCVLFELLTGEVPYTGTPEQIEYGHVLSGIPSVVTRSQGKLPKSFQAVIERALAKQPTARYPTAGALAEAFQSAAAPVAADAAQPPPSTSLPETRAVPTVAAQPVDPNPPPFIPTAASGTTSATDTPITPRLREAGAVRREEEAALLAGRSLPWKILQSWWVLLTWPIGFLAWAAFLYIGFRARRVRWLIWGVIYFTGICVALSISGDDSSGVIALVVWFGSILHALFVIRSFLRRLAFLQGQPWDRAWVL